MFLELNHLKSKYNYLRQRWAKMTYKYKVRNIYLAKVQNCTATA